MTAKLFSAQSEELKWICMEFNLSVSFSILSATTAAEELKLKRAKSEYFIPLGSLLRRTFIPFSSRPTAWSHQQQLGFSTKRLRRIIIWTLSRLMEESMLPHLLFSRMVLLFLSLARYSTVNQWLRMATNNVPRANNSLWSSNDLREWIVFARRGGFKILLSWLSCRWIDWVAAAAATSRTADGRLLMQVLYD